MKFGPVDIMFLVGTIFVMYFLFFLPQKKKQQSMQKMLSSLKKGDRVQTLSGMVGEVFAVKETIITLKFHDNVRIDFDKSAIAQTVADKSDKSEKEEKAEAKA